MDSQHSGAIHHKLWDNCQIISLPFCSLMFLYFGQTMKIFKIIIVLSKNCSLSTELQRQYQGLSLLIIKNSYWEVSKRFLQRLMGMATNIIKSRVRIEMRIIYNYMEINRSGNQIIFYQILLGLYVNFSNNTAS